MNTEDEWAQYEVVSESPQEQTTEVVDEWAQYAVPEQKEEGFFQGLGRKALGLGRRAAESIIGLPGEIEAFARRKYSEAPKEGEVPIGIAGIHRAPRAGEPKPPEPVETVFPQISELRSKSPPEWEPQGKVEELLQEFASDFPFTPGSFLKKAAITTASIAGKEVVKLLGGGDKAQVGAKMLIGLLGSRVGAKNVKNYYKEQYDLATKAIPKEATFPAKNIQLLLNKVKKQVRAGGKADWKPKVLEQIEWLEKNIKDGQVSVRAVDQSVKDLNRMIREKGVKGTPAEVYLQRIANSARARLNKYGQSNPVFAQHYKNANASFAGYAQSKKASEWLNQKKYQIGLGTGPLLLAEFFIAGGPVTAKTIAGLGAAYGVGKGAELIARITANPTLLKYYVGAVESAAKENAKQFVYNMNKLDKGLREEKPSDNQSR